MLIVQNVHSGLRVPYFVEKILKVGHASGAVKMHSPFNDIEVMKRIAERDEQAFGAIYDQYSRAIYSLAYRILQNNTLAEEVTQDTFLKVWQQTTHWDSSKGNLKSWLLAITQFTAIDRLRQERRQPALHQDPIEELEYRAGTSDHEAGWQEEIAMQSLISQLPADHAQLIDLAFFQGMTHQEIASKTNIPLGTVKTRLRTGLKRLRDLWLEIGK